MTDKKQLLLISMFFFMFAVILGCTGDREQYAGKYFYGHELELELGENGTGSWSTLEDNVSFRWEIREKQIWLHTKAGGLITGKINKNSIEINLPGVGIHSFIKKR